LVAALWWWWQRRDAAPAAAPGADAPTLDLAVTLYFPGPGTALAAETRELAVPEDAERQLVALAHALLAGPESPRLAAPLPPGVEVRSIHLGDEGIAYVDLVAPEGQAPPAGGSTEELLRVYSLVNTLALNVSAVEAVVLLWNGEQRATWSGHLDTSRPLAADPSLVARRRGSG
ncbi:MAG TPA: GerMN domain-containing protein, partial [Thermoanaerobaculia bacterium]|nr:GerMN domain-containing protein [Thermoanaerobaculia bacterium]